MSFSRVLLAFPGDAAADDALEAYAERLLILLPNAALHRTRVAIGGLGAEAAALDADLIVTGPAPAHSTRREISDFVLRAPCSVWVASERASAEIAKVLTPIDLSERSADALAVASHLVRTAGGERCQGLHVLPVSQSLTFEDIESAAKARAERALATFIARVDEEGVEVEPLVVESADTATAIVRAAQDHSSDLIVMTTRGRTRLAAYLLPSICARVIRLSAISVLVIKHHGAQLGMWDVLRDRRFRERGDVRFN